MAKERQNDPALVRSLEAIYSPGTVLPWHAHEWHQLIYASAGALTVETERCVWLVPPNRGVCVPAAVRHRLLTTTRAHLETLYFPRGTRFARECVAMHVPPLLRELIRHVISVPVLERAKVAHRRLAGVLHDLLEARAELPLSLPRPRDARALRVVEFVQNEPGSGATLGELARQVGAGIRTLERAFVAETGMGFARWRQQARLLESLRMLASGESVTAAAFHVGYNSPSAFIAAFRQVFGETPHRYSRSG